MIGAIVGILVVGDCVGIIVPLQVVVSSMHSSLRCPGVYFFSLHAGLVPLHGLPKDNSPL